MSGKESVDSGKSTAQLASEKRDRDLIDSLKCLTSEQTAIWRYFEDRASQLGAQLWSTGTWLLTIVAATLSVPFVAGFLAIPSGRAAVQVRNPVALGLVAGFGVVFCFYFYFALGDLRKHMEDNWRRAAYARTGRLEPPVWEGRKRHGWYILSFVGFLSLFAFLVMLFLAMPF